MNENQLAAEEIGKFARMFGAVIKAGEKFAAAGSLEQAVIEAQGQLDTLKAKIVELEADLGRQRAQFADEARAAVAAAAGAKAAAEADAKEIRAKAGALLEDASAKAARLALDAGAKADAIVKDALALKAEADAAVELARSNLLGLESLVTAKQEEVDALEAKLATARETIAKLVGTA